MKVLSSCVKKLGGVNFDETNKWWSFISGFSNYEWHGGGGGGAVS